MSVPERKYIWDSTKAVRNLFKHDVEFEEARRALDDPFAVVAFDEEHSIDEDRWALIGGTSRFRVLYVVYTEIDRQTFRIISARPATIAERRIYEESLRKQA